LETLRNALRLTIEPDEETRTLPRMQLCRTTESGNTLEFSSGCSLVEFDKESKHSEFDEEPELSCRILADELGDKSLKLKLAIEAGGE